LRYSHEDDDEDEKDDDGSRNMTPAGGGRKPMAEINIAPLTDVMLVLLIIFIVTAPFMMQSESRVGALKVSLPVAAKPDKAQPDVIKVKVQVDGSVYLNDAPMTHVQLKTAIGRLVQENPARAVAVYADRACRYEKVTDVVDIAKQAGARHVALAIKAKEKRQ
jgi:biopolymer transport protein ExbD